MPRPFPAHPGYGPAPSGDQVDWLLDRELAFHLVSEHADPMAICRPEADNREQHEYEHTGPGTIRNHAADLLAWHEAKIELVLEDLEDAEDAERRERVT